jgi:hypothetical protein
VVKEQSKYICISPRHDLAEKRRAMWAQDMHSILPNHETHGLAATGVYMLSIPWKSVDSAAPIHVAAYGQLIFFIDGQLRKIFVTLDDEKHKYEDKHIDTLSPLMREKCLGLIEEDIFSLEEIRVDSRARALFNVTQLLRYSDSMRRSCTERLTLFG